MKQFVSKLILALSSAFIVFSCEKNNNVITPTQTKVVFESSDIPSSIPYTGGKYTLTLKNEVYQTKSVEKPSWGYRIKYDGEVKKSMEFTASATSLEIEIEANPTAAQRQIVVEFASNTQSEDWKEVAKATQEFNPELLPQNHVLVVVGQEYLKDKGFYDAVAWMDGKRFAFTNGEHDSFCNAVCTYKDSVFVAACEAVGDLVHDEWYGDYNENNGVVYSFKIGEEANFKRTVYSDVKGKSTASGVAYSNGNIYVSGFDSPSIDRGPAREAKVTLYVSGFDSPSIDRRALYWKNSEKHELTDGSTDALAYCIAADGDDVYVGGYIQSKDFKKEGAAVIWKNGVAQKLTGDGILAKVNKIVIEDGHVYAAGAYRDVLNGTTWQGALWIDGELTLFTEPASVEVGGLYVKDGKWIVNGTMTLSTEEITAYNWYSDGTAEQLIPNSDMCQGLGVTKIGDDVYSLANMYYYTEDYDMFSKSYVLKNKEAIEMQVNSPEDFTFWGLDVANF